MSIGNTMLRCRECRNFYDLNELVKKADSKNQKNIYCEKCGIRLGILN